MSAVVPCPSCAVIDHKVDDLKRTMEQVLSRLGISQIEREKVVIMIDRTNLDQSWRRADTFGGRPDYLKIKSYLQGNRTCRQVRVYYSDYDQTMVPPEDRGEWQRRQDFYTFLRHRGWVLRSVKKRMYDGVAVEKGLDALLIMDMHTIARRNLCDTIILVAGDADYCDVISSIQREYCMCAEVSFFHSQTARDLQNRASRFVNLEPAMADLSREAIANGR